MDEDAKTKYRRELFTTVPPQPDSKKDGQLPMTLVSKFFEEGYLVIPDFFEREKLDGCRDTIDELVDELANRLHAAGKIKNLYKEYDLFTRLTHISKEFPGANIVLHKISQISQAFINIWTDERLLRVVEQLIGPDIMGHPVWNLRTKIPNNEATVVPWHQDSAYLDEDAVDVLQLTAWIPFLDANTVNGTLEVAQGAHRHGRLATHVCCYRGTWYVEVLEDEMEKSLKVDLKKDVKVCEVPYGGLILFSNMLPHRSLPNLSNNIRWSIDLRWQTPHKKVGFYNLKEGILIRTKENPNHIPDWAAFNAIDRNEVQLTAMEMKEEAADPFDTTVSGPWMKKWELVNTNKHTSAYRESKEAWHKA